LNHNQPEVNSHYDAIICYVDHNFDRQAAKTLRDQIVRYIPPRKGFEKNVRERFDQIYIETIEEVQQAGLTDATRLLLDISEFLIVVCSPRAKDSVRLKEIVEYFKSLGKEERILPLLIESEPSQAFPPALFGERTISLPNSRGEIEQVKVEPLATDIRTRSVRKSLARIRQMRLKIIAAMIGCSYDDLEQRHLKRVRQRVIVVTSLIAAVALGLISIFIYLRQNAIRQETIAKKQTQMAVDLLNSMFHELPKKFKDIRDAKPVLYGLLLDNIRALRVSGSQTIKNKKIDIEEVLRVKPGDSAKLILRKVRLLREFGRKREVLEALDAAQKVPDSSLPDEYFKEAQLFTQAGFTQGEYVIEIESGMPAVMNGMTVGDIIIELNGVHVGEYNDLWETTNKLPFDGTVTVTYLRLEKSGAYVKRSFKTKLHDGMLGIVYEAI
jgi:hypothetical protein